MSHSDESAFPLFGAMENLMQSGLTKREYFAAMALPAIIQTCAGDDRQDGISHEELFARKAVDIADELIRILNL